MTKYNSHQIIVLLRDEMRYQNFRKRTEQLHLNEAKIEWGSFFHFDTEI